MEKSKVQNDDIDSNEYLAFEYVTLESNLLREQEYPDLPSPTPIKDAVESGERRRPITLKADLGTAKSAVPTTKKTQAKKARQTKETNESGRRRRPITLKADLDTAKPDVPATKKTQAKKARQTKKINESGRRRRPITLKADLDTAKPAVPATKKTQVKKTRHRKDASGPQINKKVSVEAKPTAETPNFYDTPTTIPSLTIDTITNYSQFFFSWAIKHQRLLLVVVLSFISGILFHGWFVPDELPAPNQVTDSDQAAHPSVSEKTDYGTRLGPNSGYVSDSSSHSNPAASGYPPEYELYRNPSHGSPWPQRPSSQNPNYWQGDYGHQMTPQTPSTDPWRGPAGQTAPDYGQRTIQKYIPWSYKIQ